MFPPGWRERALAALPGPFDLVILGGGITGSGIFLDASQRGLRCLLVERGDIACGTSSRSSKLIHGGLRYLKNLQLRVTRDSCRERDRQLALAPHLVEPLTCIYPAYRHASPPGWQVELGLRLYDRLTRGPEKHRQLSTEELEELAPDLPREDLERALGYVDGRTDDARLTWSVAATGLAFGGQALTRATLEEPRLDADQRLRGLLLRDLESGQTHEVETRLVLNATGAWTDATRHRLGLSGQHLRPSRGSHLLVRKERLPLRAAVTLPAPSDRRPVFFVPHPEGVLVGTTDLFHDGNLDDPRPSQAEVDYLLEAARASFPERRLGLDDVSGAFAGLRPVLDDQAEDPSAASREEAIWYEQGILSVAGGKLTTWRSTAEEAVDRALTHLPEERRRAAAPCATAGTSLAGLAPRDQHHALAGARSLEPAIAAAMARRLGALAWTATELARDGGELDPLTPDTDLCVAEVRAHLRFGGVLHLSDLMLRRTRIGMWDPHLADELAPRLRHVLCRELEWDSRRWTAELETYAQEALAWKVEGIQPAEGSPSTVRKDP